MNHNQKGNKNIAEDTVAYNIFPPHESADESFVTAFCSLIISYVDQIVPKSHIWHRDQFNLDVVRSESTTQEYTWILTGATRIGDSIDDEWCMVWLLSEISKKWHLPIQIYDTDGEFLLIEAAEHLPRWITPINTENRVWIYNGVLHIIPTQYRSASRHPLIIPRLFGAPQGSDESHKATSDAFDTYVSEVDAIRTLQDGGIDTLASNSIQTTIHKRIQGYPAAFAQHIYVVKAFIPIDIAVALTSMPSLVQKAAEAFYTRDALQLRAAAKMARFSPSTAIFSQVTLTRTAYAQLAGQNFHPPKVFGRWPEAPGTKEWRWKDIGMKIACGFEMLYSERKGKRSPVLDRFETMQETLDALNLNSAYTAYMEKLVQMGFFPSNEARGSARWKEYEVQAARVWNKVNANENNSHVSFGTLLDHALVDAEPQRSMLLERSPNEIQEDSDHWLYVEPDDVENTFRISQEPTVPEAGKGLDPLAFQANPSLAHASTSDDDAPVREQARNLGNFATKVAQFVNRTSGVEGAEFDDDVDSDEDEVSMDSQSSPDGSDAELSPARLEALDCLVPPLNPGEYGKLPLDASYIGPFKSQSTSTPSLMSETRVMPSGEQRTIRKPLLMRDKFDGIDSDDETDEDEGALNMTTLLDEAREEYESDDEKPAIAGIHLDVDIDMAEEQETFIQFAKETLGLTDEMWANILRERTQRGAFIPSLQRGLARENIPQVEVESAPVPGRSSPPQVTGESGSLMNFESAMQAMDSVLEHSRHEREALRRAGHAGRTSASAGGVGNKGKTRDRSPGSIESMMDAELQSSLQHHDDSDDNENETADAGMDYNLIKNFLESFKSQAGLAGPVSSLAGRLQPGWSFGRDSAAL